MNREETHALFAQGKDAWSAWAEDMLAKKKALQDAGQWDMGKDIHDNPEPNNPETKAWLEAASVVFSTSDEPHKFEHSIDFRDWSFPGVAGFSAATFAGQVRFEGATFAGVVWFEQARFAGWARFDRATFAERARFDWATFEGVSWFSNATFSATASYCNAKFDRMALFSGSHFRSNVDFSSVDFSGLVIFNDARFDQDLEFTAAIFSSGASLKSSLIYGELGLEGAKSSGTFDIAGSRLRYPPLLPPDISKTASTDGVRISTPSLFWSLFKKSDPLLETKYRRYKAIAIRDHDNFQRHNFFVGELVGRLLSHHGRISPITWVGLLYEATSNFGRSFLRPALAFVMLALISGAIYLGESERAGGQTVSPFVDRLHAVIVTTLPFDAHLPQLVEPKSYACAEASGDNRRALEPSLADPSGAAAEAMHLAWANASIVGSIGGGDGARRMYGCLFGLVEDKGGNAVPIVPAGVSSWLLWQKALSVILIFLFGLAIRNMLKMH